MYIISQLDMLEDEIKELTELGIEHVLLFGVPDDHKKDCLWK